jgi:chromosome segregation ATPase
LEAGERQLAQLKTAVLSLGTRLEEEIKRGDDLEKALEASKSRIHTLDMRIATMGATRVETEHSIVQLNENIRSTTNRAELAERELSKAQKIIDDLARERDRANEALHRSKATTRKHELALKELEGWRSGFLIRQRELEGTAYERGMMDGETEERRHAMKAIQNMMTTRSVRTATWTSGPDESQHATESQPEQSTSGPRVLFYDSYPFAY